MRAILSFLGLTLLLTGGVSAQQATRTEPVTGIRDNGIGFHALVGARAVTAPGQVLDGATIVIRNGLFQRSFELGGAYPNSAMGTIALIKQTFMDADWYMRAWGAYEASGRAFLPPETSEALAALEDAVRGTSPTHDSLKEASQAVMDIVDPIDDPRGSAGYKRDMSAVFARRAMEQVLGVATG
ncbi:MAG: hypothetical protein IIA54_00860 [Chloroflexi bacterium]|nr:hypothetical protein [Chloroflexota bacterium]